MPAIKAQPAAPSFWVEPTTISFQTSSVQVGSQFNVTVWGAAAVGVSSWDVELGFNASQLQAITLGFTAGATSELFAGHTTFVSTTINNTAGYVDAFETTLGLDFVTPSSGSLFWVTFRIATIPVLGENLTCSIDPAYGIPSGDTFFCTPYPDLNFETPNTAFCTYTCFGTVSPVPSSTSLYSSLSHACVNSPITCTAFIGGSYPTGTVSWSSNSSTGLFDPSVSAVSSETSSTTFVEPRPGNVVITASYSGDSNNMPSVGKVILTMTPYGNVYIRADGSVDPPTAPISTEDKSTYKMTNCIFASSLEIQRDNVMFDGMGYSLQGGGSGDGVSLSGRSNVTFENANIQQFTTGISLDASSDCTISGNDLQNNTIAIRLDHSSDDAVFRNDARSCEAGVRLDSSSNNNISENHMEASSWTGICLENSLDNLISDNNVTANWGGILLFSSNNNSVDVNTVNANSFEGIDLESSSSNKVVGNNVTANGDYGITLSYSSDNEVSENHLNANGYYGLLIFCSSSNTVFGNVVTATAGFGVWLFCSSNNTLVDNAMVNNGYNFMVERLTEYDLNSVAYADFVNNVDTSNTVDGKPIYYWIDKQDLSVPKDAGYVILVNCTRIKVQDLNVTGNGQGILLAYTTDSTVTGNVVSNGYDGIVLESSTDNAVSENNIATNYYFGLWLSSSSKNSIVGNNAVNNRVGIALTSSSSNNIYHNNFCAERITAISFGICVFTTSDSINTWDAGYASGGNYWSDYSGVDKKNGPYQNLTGGDGIGDTPYVVDSRNVDYYPLMQPWTSLLHDVAVTNVTSNHTWVYQGIDTEINVTIQNEGDYAGNVSIALYYNITANDLAGMQRVTVSPGSNQTLTFVWNTKDVPYGHNYTLTAVAMTTDNAQNGGPITIRIMGDINNDGKADGRDLTIAARAFGTRPGDSKWNPDADINQDGRVDGRDLTLIARHFGESYAP